MIDQSKIFEPHWPEGLAQDKIYTFKCDDACPDEEITDFSLVIAVDGDVHLFAKSLRIRGENSTPNPFPSVRCRHYFGGGRHTRTHQALLWLAQAIRLDSEELSR